MLICRQCGLEQDELKAKIEKHFLSNGGYHMTAHCFQCGSFIKNMPHSLPQILHFGKYKGKPIAVVAKENPSYLRWLCNQGIKDNLKNSIQTELDKVEYDPLQQCFKLS